MPVKSLMCLTWKPRLFEFLILLLLMWTPNVQGYGQSLEWSGFRRLNKNQLYTEVLGSKEGGILLRRFNPRKEQKKIFLDLYSPDLQFEETQRIRFGRNEFFQSSFLLNDRIYVFYTLYKRKSRQILLNVRIFSDELRGLGEKTVLWIDSVESRKAPFAIQKNVNETGFVIAYNPYMVMSRQQLTFHSTDTAFSDVHTHKIDLVNNPSTWLDQWLVTEDDIIAIVHAYSEGEQEKRSESALYRKSLRNGNQQYHQMNDDTAYATQVMMAYDRVNNTVVLAGFFSKQYSIFEEGNFYGRLDLDNDSFFSRYQLFPQELLDKALGKFSGDPGLLSFFLEGISLTADGDAVISAEEVDVNRKSIDASLVDPMPRSYIRYYYYLNNILALSINNAGTLNRFDVIKKEQVTLNDGAYFSSYQTITQPEQIRFLFNDLTRKNPNLMSYGYDGMHPMHGELVLSGNEYNGKLVIREAKQVSPNSMLIPSIDVRKGYALVRITW